MKSNLVELAGHIGRTHELDSSCFQRSAQVFGAQPASALLNPNHLQGLPAASSVNTQEFLSALRLVSAAAPAAGSASPAIGRHFVELLQHQSARTRCARGLPNPQTPDLLDVCWDEVFIFELASGGEACFDVVVTNQGANGGRGAVVGGVTVPVPQSNTQDASLCELEWLTLRTSDGEENGRISIGVHVVGLEKGEGSGGEKWKAGKVVDRKREGTGGLQLGLGEDGPWSPLRSVIPVGAFVRTIGGLLIVIQVSCFDGCKDKRQSPSWRICVFSAVLTFYAGDDCEVERKGALLRLTIDAIWKLPLSAQPTELNAQPLGPSFDRTTVKVFQVDTHLPKRATWDMLRLRTFSISNMAAQYSSARHRTVRISPHRWTWQKVAST